MDEPTNDLDVETLELLEEMVADYAGTLLLVSHDRAFIDNVVTSTLVFEGAGRVQEYVGGYEDWLRQSQVSEPETSVRARDVPTPLVPRAASPRKKLSFREQQELVALPPRIDELEREQRRLTAAVASPDFYKESREQI